DWPPLRYERRANGGTRAHRWKTARGEVRGRHDVRRGRNGRSGIIRDRVTPWDERSRVGQSGRRATEPSRIDLRRAYLHERKHVGVTGDVVRGDHHRLAALDVR